MIVFTSSDAAVNALTRLRLRDRSVAWSDPLYMGMVSPHWDLGAFASARAVAHRSFGWDEDKLVEKDFSLRNEFLQEAVSGEEEVALLFGPGVGDQLNLAHLLAWVTTHAAGVLQRTRLATSERNLDLLTDEEIGDLLAGAGEIFAAAADQYRGAWAAYVSPDPQFLENYLYQAADSPYSGKALNAVKRVLREYPSSENGLSLTEGQILDCLRLGLESPRELYEAYSQTEEHCYLRNWDFWAYLDRLAGGEKPLIETESGTPFLCPPKALAWDLFYGQKLRLTDWGSSVLNGDAMTLCAEGRWIGGVQLEAGAMWYWDYPRESLTREARELANA
ncbi:MAG: hypothetical protein AAGB46_10035 [Verrucomicrobiota bacterium]